MKIKKEEMAKFLEDISNSVGVKCAQLANDISFTILFLSLYAGNNSAKVEDIKLKIQNSKVKIVKNGKYNEEGKKFNINSYDGSQELEVIFSKSYLKIEKKFENEFSYYFVEYFLKPKGLFIRNCISRSAPIDKELELQEKSEGNPEGIYFSEVIEKNEGINITFIKVPDKNKVQNIYYSYSFGSEGRIFYKLPKEIKKIPFVNSLGFKNFVDILEDRESEYIRFDDECLFDDLVKMGKSYYKK